MSLFILFGFIFVGYSGQAVVNDDISVSFDESFPSYFEEDSRPEFFDIGLAGNRFEVRLKNNFCNSLTRLSICFSGVSGIGSFFYCKGEWEKKVEDLRTRIQNTVFAISVESLQAITDEFYKNIDICRQKNTITEQLFCAKYVVLESSRVFYNTYRCSELSFRVGRFRSSYQ